MGGFFEIYEQGHLKKFQESHYYNNYNFGLHQGLKNLPIKFYSEWFPEIVSVSSFKIYKITPGGLKSALTYSDFLDFRDSGTSLSTDLIKIQSSGSNSRFYCDGLSAYVADLASGLYEYEITLGNGDIYESELFQVCSDVVTNENEPVWSCEYSVIDVSYDNDVVLSVTISRTDSGTQDATNNVVVRWSLRQDAFDYEFDIIFGEGNEVLYEQSQAVTIKGGESEEVTFSISSEYFLIGTNVVLIDSNCGQVTREFEIVGASDIQLDTTELDCSTLTLDNATSSINGDTAVILDDSADDCSVREVLTMNFGNDGDVYGELIWYVFLNGEQYETGTIGLDANSNGSVEVTFNTEFDKGENTIEIYLTEEQVLERTVTFDVDFPASEPSFTYNDDLTISRSCKNVSGSFTVTETAGVAGNASYEIFLDGVFQNTVTKAFSGSDTQNYNYSLSNLSTGTRTIEVRFNGSKVGEIQVTIPNIQITFSYSDADVEQLGTRQYRAKVKVTNTSCVDGDGTVYFSLDNGRLIRDSFSSDAGDSTTRFYSFVDIQDGSHTICIFQPDKVTQIYCENFTISTGASITCSDFELDPSTPRGGWALYGKFRATETAGVDTTFGVRFKVSKTSPNTSVRYYSTGDLAVSASSYRDYTQSLFQGKTSGGSLSDGSKPRLLMTLADVQTGAIQAAYKVEIVDGCSFSPITFNIDLWDAVGRVDQPSGVTLQNYGYLGVPGRIYATSRIYINIDTRIRAALVLDINGVGVTPIETGQKVTSFLNNDDNTQNQIVVPTSDTITFIPSGTYTVTPIIYLYDINGNYLGLNYTFSDITGWVVP